MNTRSGNAILSDSQAALRKLADRAEQARERQAFNEVIQRHQASVTRLVARLLAWPADQAHIDDVVQEVFLSAWQHRESYRGESELGTWLGRIAINKARNYVRGRVRFGNLVTQLKSMLVRDDAPSTKGVGFDRLHEAIAVLRASDREVIVLRYLEEKSPDEIAELLQVKRNTVDARLARARRRLERILKARDAADAAD